MVARASINIVSQIGVETTPGTGVAASKQFPGLQLELMPELGTKFYRPAGRKYNQIGVLNQISSKGKFDGPLSFGEIVYLLAGCVNYAAPVTATGATTWTFKPAAAAADTTKTFTVQRGDATLCQEVNYGLINALTISIDRKEAKVSGEVLARKINNAATLTADATVIENVPVSMNDVSVFLDSTFGGLGTTKITDAFEFEFRLPDRYKEKWVLDSTQTSWKEPVEVPVAPTVKLCAEYNTQTQGIYNAMVADALPTRFLRVVATGDAVGSANYKFQFDGALKLKDAKEKKDQDGVYAYEMEFEVVDDAGWAKPFEFVVVNGTASL